ncbi:Protein kinase kin1 [Cytospora mali]|uniref:non-specific serine/threonine protein kinase n=1 Tax=Cytospora mali TaxID=578113 RepID=A0A194W0Z0_CYTMA|nr:Protein kinase kin1 [Valsa mali]
MTTAISPGSEAPHPSPPRPLIHSSRNAHPKDPSSSARTQSTRSRHAAPVVAAAAAAAQPQPSSAANRSSSTSTSHRHSSNNASRQREVLPHQQHEHERTNVARHHRSSTSRDRDRDPSATRPGSSSSRPHRRNSQRSPRVPQQSPAEMATTVAHNTGPAAVQPSADPRSSGQPKARSRTTIPTQSGKWILGKTIGAGSMGKVKLAKKEDTNEQVACKIIPRGSPDDGHHSRAEKERNEQGKEIRTAREAAIVTLLNHPYICGLRDVVRTNYHWYMLFEYVNGGQMLDYIISHGKLKEKQARKFSRQITSALDYCHRNSIVHRDLKIENILISKTGDIKIIDFGLSNLFSPRSHLKTFCGSLYFAAPELLQARAYTGPEVDVWSFGIVLYVLVCGKVPFDDQSMPALHAKIKKGLVDYPNWLSSECKNLLGRMLVTDPKQRATMAEVMSHPWMNKGYSSPPDNFLPRREPITLPLDPEVINAMTGFNFGPPEVIKSQLTRLVESEEYQRGVRAFQQEKDMPQPTRDGDKKRGMFDFYKRRNSMNSRDTLTAPSSEALGLGNDPMNAFSPLLSIYYLVKEKQDRERVDNVVPTLSAQQPPAQKEKDPMPEIAPPQEAHTNASAYEMPGEKATGGRTRPRARTHGEDEAPDKALLSPKAALGTENQTDRPEKKESAAAGILRRFSTRRRPKDPERLDRNRSHPPQVHVQSPTEQPPVPGIPVRKSFSIRRSRRERDDGSSSQIRSGSSQPQHSDLLSPPIPAGASTTGQKKVLGRSTSVNSAEFRRKKVMGSGTDVKDPPPTSGSDHSTERERPRPQAENRGALSSRSVSMRAKSLGHARRESIQARRARREEQREANVPEETDADVGDTSGLSNERLDNSDLAKPVFLKGLFSVSTTSTKPVAEIRADIKRVLKELGVDYTEIRGGFHCVRAPSIDLKKVEPPNSPNQLPGHRRRFSFGIRGERAEDVRDVMEGAQPNTPRTPGRAREDRSGSNSDVSDIETSRDHGGPSRRPPGETTTRVQDDLGGNMVLEFEVFIVKVPMISLHGIQFKRMAGNTWQFKNMADHILKELRL